MSLLTDGILSLGLEPNAARLEALETYLSEIELWNRRIDLVKATGDQLITKHVLDSLSGVKIISSLPHSTIADVGSGAGFPGIPLALFLEESRISLVERSSKRASFLRNVVALLGLRGRVEVVERELESLASEHAIVTFRAFRGFVEFAPLLFRAAGPNGALVAYKGKRQTVLEELKGVEGLLSTVEIHPVCVPGMEEERNIVVIRRT